jgi:hypothetical protein
LRNQRHAFRDKRKEPRARRDGSSIGADGNDNQPQATRLRLEHEERLAPCGAGDPQVAPNAVLPMLSVQGIDTTVRKSEASDDTLSRILQAEAHGRRRIRADEVTAEPRSMRRARNKEHDSKAGKPTGAQEAAAHR